MSGLIPVKRSVEEISRADSELLRKHHEYLASWIAQRKPQMSASQPPKLHNTEVVDSKKSSLK
jgi:hypothetical protein